MGCSDAAVIFGRMQAKLRGLVAPGGGQYVGCLRDRFAGRGVMRPEVPSRKGLSALARCLSSGIDRAKRLGATDGGEERCDREPA
jgi:hypothetical protein